MLATVTTWPKQEQSKCPNPLHLTSDPSPCVSVHFQQQMDTGDMPNTAAQATLAITNKYPTADGTATCSSCCQHCNALICQAVACPLGGRWQLHHIVAHVRNINLDTACTRFKRACSLSCVPSRPKGVYLQPLHKSIDGAYSLNSQRHGHCLPV